MGDDGLVEAITGPGCPMCTHVAKVAPQYLDSLLYQHTTDRAYRDRFLAGGGFCERHVRAAVVADTAGNGDGVGGGIFLLGAAIMLFNVLMTVRKSVSAGSLRDARGTPAAAAA